MLVSVTKITDKKRVNKECAIQSYIDDLLSGKEQMRFDGWMIARGYHLDPEDTYTLCQLWAQILNKCHRDFEAVLDVTNKFYRENKAVDDCTCPRILRFSVG